MRNGYGSYRAILHGSIVQVGVGSCRYPSKELGGCRSVY